MAPVDQKKILIVEDSIAIAQMLQACISEHWKNVEVALSHDGEDGEKKAAQMLPDMIILDITLPKKSGINIFKDLTASDRTKDIPILFLSSRGEMEDIFDKMGAAGFISKAAPFNVKLLMSEIERILKKLPKPYVFVIDSETKANVAELKDALKKHGIKAVTINSMEILKDAINEHTPICFAVEYEREWGDGSDIIENLKKHYEDIQIIVYVFSGADKKEESFKAGADFYIDNPKDHDELLGVIKKIQKIQSAKIDSKKQEEEIRKIKASQFTDQNKPKASDLGFFK